MHLVGVDCATNPNNVGIARAKMGDTIEVQELHAGIAGPWSKVVDWLSEIGDRDVLLALDAPLGWPTPLSQALEGHSAGDLIEDLPNTLFRRTTDRSIHDVIGKQSLDVGADRIARTAHAALQGLALLRKETCDPIPLAWSNDELNGAHAIEVYPAATLKAHGLRSDGYKDKKKMEHQCAREEILEGLPSIEIPPCCRSLALANADGLDALVCVLAAADFVRGRAMPPHSFSVARREGWIWCRDPND